MRHIGDALAWLLVFSLSALAGCLIYAPMTDIAAARWLWGITAAAAACGAVGVAIVKRKTH